MSERTKFIVLAGLAGAALGAAGAWTYLRSQETGLWVTKKERGQKVQVKAGAGDFARVGLAVFAIVRQLQSLAKPA